MQKRVPQSKVHSSINHTLSLLRISEESMDEFFKALQAVWSKNETIRQDSIGQLENQREALKTRKSELITSLSTNPGLAEDIKKETAQVKSQIVSIEGQIVKGSERDD